MDRYLFSNQVQKEETTKLSPIYTVVYYLLLIICGVIWGLGQWPTFFFFRFFALIPFIFIVLYRKHYILETFVFGSVAYIMNFYWLYITFRESGKMPVIFAVGIPVVLSMYYGLQYPLIAFIYKKLYKLKPRVMYYSLPLVFVCIDSTYIKIFKHSIADSMIAFRPFVQLVDITGMTGLILIFMLFNLGLFQLIEKVARGWQISFTDFLFVLPLVLAVGYGECRIVQINKQCANCETVTASMIQGNITGKQKLDSSYFETNLNRYNDLTKQAMTDNTVDLIIWPESVFNRALSSSKDGLKDLIFDDYLPMILGIVTYTNDGMHNSAILVEKRAERQRYYKEELLMFGEYVPLEKAFPFLRKITPLSSSSKPGKTSSVLYINDKIHSGITICFEEIFPQIVRRKCNEGCNLLVNITNDSWFGRGLGPLHHSILGRLRAIENRKSFYRCTATGFTTACDPTGKIIAAGEMDCATIVTATLPLYEHRSIYSYIGELFTYLCDLFVIFAIIYAIRKYFLSQQ